MSRKEDSKSESDEDDDEETTFMSRTRHFANQVIFKFYSLKFLNVK